MSGLPAGTEDLGGVGRIGGANPARFCCCLRGVMLGELYGPTAAAAAAAAAAAVGASGAVPGFPERLACRQGLTLVHSSAQLKRLLCDRGCSSGLFRGCLGAGWGY